MKPNRLFSTVVCHLYTVAVTEMETILNILKTVRVHVWFPKL